MFIDASALVSILLPEEDGEALMQRVQEAETRIVTPLVIFETVLAIKRVVQLSVSDAWHILSLFLQRCDIVVVEIGADVHSQALLAYDRYGKGMGHPAQLNLGDCFSYAMAKSLRLPLLYKGGDFSQTDLA